MIIDPQKMSDYESNCQKLKFYLGEELSSWLFSPQARVEAGLDIPRLPTNKGATVVLFRGCKPSSCIADGFALPFRWRQGGDSADSQAPASIFAEAERVRDMLEAHLQEKDPGLSLQDWWLDLNLGHSGLNLKRFEATSESAAVPLAAGLLLALRGGHPSANVLSTGAIDNDGYIYSVNGYAQKLAAADILMPQSANAKRLFFVPPADFANARVDAQKYDIKLESFDANRPFYDTMETILSYMDQAPNADAPLNAHIAYANRLHLVRNSRDRSTYYKRYIVERLGSQTPKPTTIENLHKLLLPVSLYPENSMLSMAILKPRAVHLVCSRQSHKHFGELKKFAENIGIESVEQTLLPIEEQAVEPADIAKLTQWLSADLEGQCAVDFTPGNREMLAAVLAAGINSQAKLLYIRHSVVSGSNSVEYGSEQLVELNLPGANYHQIL
jgi:hypothetical protein